MRAGAFKATSSLELRLIELPKADRLRRATEPAVLADWVAYFEHWQEDTIMNAITHEPIRQAMQQLQDLSADEEAQRMAFVRERALRDEKSELRAARREERAAVLARLLQLKFGALSDATQQCLEQAKEGLHKSAADVLDQPQR